MIYTDTLQTIIMIVGSFILMGFGNTLFTRRFASARALRLTCPSLSSFR